MLKEYGKNLASTNKLKAWEIPDVERTEIGYLETLYETLQKRIREDAQRKASWQLNPQCPEAILEELTQTIEAAQKQAALLAEKLDPFVAHHAQEEALFTFIPGIGKKTARFLVLLFCFGRKFDSAKSLAAFIGIDPNTSRREPASKEKDTSEKRDMENYEPCYICVPSVPKNAIKPVKTSIKGYS